MANRHHGRPLLDQVDDQELRELLGDISRSATPPQRRQRVAAFDETSNLGPVPPRMPRSAPVIDDDLMQEAHAFGFSSVEEYKEAKLHEILRESSAEDSQNEHEHRVPHFAESAIAPPVEPASQPVDAEVAAANELKQSGSQICAQSQNARLQALQKSTAALAAADDALKDAEESQESKKNVDSYNALVKSIALAEETLKQQLAYDSSDGETSDEAHDALSREDRLLFAKHVNDYEQMSKIFDELINSVHHHTTVAELQQLIDEAVAQWLSIDFWAGRVFTYVGYNHPFDEFRCYLHSTFQSIFEQIHDQPRSMIDDSFVRFINLAPRNPEAASRCAKLYCNFRQRRILFLDWLYNVTNSEILDTFFGIEDYNNGGDKFFVAKNANKDIIDVRLSYLQDKDREEYLDEAAAVRALMRETFRNGDPELAQARADSLAESQRGGQTEQQTSADKERFVPVNTVFGNRERTVSVDERQPYDNRSAAEPDMPYQTGGAAEADDLRGYDEDAALASAMQASLREEEANRISQSGWI